eukprot:CAMPEP_0171095832 /NCGR_PEP_ID=MMETSP0766_2-20121228/43392_1 /TAXON_ID=439317 /ORGANISM="Gambierdiscus australes, Strain CAWD 149" /LENGTH=401 /DNA_ID=CAMNT_0011554693 /DNA_START=161 /DNA_END=1366 /DNA_ORIENTATION=+
MNLRFHESSLSLAANRIIGMADLDELERAAVAAQEWEGVASLTLDSLRARMKSARKFKELTDRVIDAARLSLADPRYNKAQRLLEAVHKSIGLVHHRLETLWPAAIGSKGNRSAGEGNTGHGGELVLNVTERPFGAHVQRGTTRVAEVFPGFPAQHLGVQPGCEITAIAGRSVMAGDWMEAFQKAPLPFEMRLRCKRLDRERATGDTKSDPHRFRVMVLKKPFGMNINVRTAPRVVEVLPGFPAEASGVKRGFVLTEVDDGPVDAINWFKAFEETPLPFTLTFDTTVLWNQEELSSPGSTANHSYLSLERELPPHPDTEYTDFQCEVVALPFGMELRTPSDKNWPSVYQVLPRGLAEQQGVRKGDVLVAVAGVPVDSTTWFAVFQQAAPPFGLHFRRPFKL